MARDSSLAALTEFDKTTLKKSETCEKNPLPPAEAIAQEMEHLKFKVSHIRIYTAHRSLWSPLCCITLFTLKTYLADPDTFGSGS
jgi:Thymosin beta-4 family